MYMSTLLEEIVTQRRPRNPAERRRQLVTAAAEVIRRDGPAALSHRSAAARAGLPLGATTQYFATLDDLRSAGLEYLADETDRELAEFGAMLSDADDPVAALADYLSEYLADPEQVAADSALYMAAARSPEFRPLALRWSDGLLAELGPRFGIHAARALALFVEGAASHACLGQPAPEPVFVARVVRTLLTGTFPSERP